jgi:hypothetical protein
MSSWAETTCSLTTYIFHNLHYSDDVNTNRLLKRLKIARVPIDTSPRHMTRTLQVSQSTFSEGLLMTPLTDVPHQFLSCVEKDDEESNIE